MKLVTYTAATGAIDPPRKDVHCVTGYDRFVDPRRNARAVKLLSHLFVEADVSIWIDANIELLVPPERLVAMMGEWDVGLFRHSERADIYEEAEACIRMKKDRPENIRPQIDRYRAAGYAKRDLGMTFILIRRHTREINRLNELWFAELCRHSVRDQISFPFVFDGYVKYFDPVPLTRCEYFIRHPHGVAIA